MSRDQNRGSLSELIARMRDSPKGRTIIDGREDRVKPLLLRRFKLNGLSFAIDTFGVRVGFSLEDTSVLLVLLDRLPIGWQAAPFEDLNQHYKAERLDDGYGGDRYRLTDIASTSLGEGNWEDLSDAIESRLEDFVAQHASPWIFIHAGVVGWNGRAILIPAGSFKGKSTLTTALVAAGAEYYSDEFAVVDQQGKVYPFPRRITLRTGEHAPWNIERIDIGDYREDDSAPVPLSVGLVALLDYDPDRTFWFESLDPGAAIMALCGHVVAIRRRPAESLSVARAIVDEANVVRGFRGEADEAASRLLAMNGG